MGSLEYSDSQDSISTQILDRTHTGDMPTHGCNDTALGQHIKPVDDQLQSSCESSCSSIASRIGNDIPDRSGLEENESNGDTVCESEELSSLGGELSPVSSSSELSSSPQILVIVFTHPNHSKSFIHFENYSCVAQIHCIPCRLSLSLSLSLYFFKKISVQNTPSNCFANFFLDINESFVLQ
jgi:hypothetical protein